MSQSNSLKKKTWSLQSMQLKTCALNNMPDPMLIFDSNDCLQMYNDVAERMLKIPSNYTLDEYVKDHGLGYAHDVKEGKKDKTKEFIRTKVLDVGTYLVHGKELWDEKGKYVGFLVNYTDITAQEKLKDEATMYATRDQLTGLWNRDYFFEIAAKTIREYDLLLDKSNV